MFFIFKFQSFDSNTNINFIVKMNIIQIHKFEMFTVHAIP